MALPELFLPSTLPDWKASAHVITPEPMYGEVPRQAGASRKRKLFTIVPRMLAVDLEVTQAQLETFYSWFEGPLLAGAQSFTAKVAKIGAGVEYWEANILSYTADTEEGQLRTISAQLKLKGLPSDTAPVPTSLASEALAILNVTIDGGYAMALSAEARPYLDASFATGAPFSAEVVVHTYTEFAGPQSGVPLDAEVWSGLETLFIVLPSEAFTAEVAALLDVSLVPTVALSAEVTAALLFTFDTALGFVASPGGFAVSSTVPAFPGNSARALVQVGPDGTISKRVGTGAYVYVQSWYTPTLAGVGAGKWVRATLSSGDSPAGDLVGVALDLTYTRAWYLEETALGTLDGTIQIDIATDPDILSVVSSFTVYLTADRS